ncbi:MAG: UDP-N-acetylmuramoyl-L-alanyl-D-glutamate--2,6-diaminopimelate ligase [Firmicutes bacterium]|nr:UDP-N-acetylmuramoyl-L-alanyl-D-glutamate--2,6-diaminopimelate ligase [Bacillota bacterium]
MINIKTDSRKIVPGDTFVALRGISSDGHDYIEKAIELGAVRIIAEEGDYSVETVIVDDSRKYLEDLLKQEYGHILDEMKIIGVTGTNGKTTSCYLIYQALNRLGFPCSYIGTIGYYREGKIKSLPNTSVDLCDLYELLVDSYDNGYKYVALEVSSQGLAYGRFNGIKFDIAGFTNLTQDHLDFHHTMEGYALAKQQLFKQLKDDSKVFVNSDDNYKQYYLLDNNINFTYGLNSGDYKVIDFKMSRENTIFTYSYNNFNYTVSCELVGEYNLYNLLLTISILNQLGIDLTKINEVVRFLKAPKGRMEKINYNNNLIVIDYAHTPDAIENIINSTKKFTLGNIYVVFGCTGDRDRTKRPIMTKLVLDNVAKAIITIDDPHNEDPNLIVTDMLEGVKSNNYEIYLDRGIAIQKGIDLLTNDDTLLILGKGHEEFIIIGDKKIPFNDSDIVLNYVNKSEINV